MNSLLPRMKAWRLLQAPTRRWCLPTRTVRGACSERLKGTSKNEVDVVPTLQVSEVFKSVQGEGPFTGCPSVFLRLGICNLSCVWCDTPYTWLFTEDRLQKVRKRVAESNTPDRQLPTMHTKNNELERHSTEEVVDHVLTLAGSTVRNVVITGGEPLLHKKHLLQIVDRFMANGLSVEFETNGTISPDGLPSGVHLNVSPKLSNSLQPFDLRVNVEVLKACLAFPSSVLKFVIDSPEDIDEAVNIVNAVGADAKRVYLMPQGTVSFCYAITSKIIVSCKIQSRLLISNGRGACNLDRVRSTLQKKDGGWLTNVCSSAINTHIDCTLNCGVRSEAYDGNTAAIKKSKREVEASISKMSLALKSHPTRTKREKKSYNVPSSSATLLSQEPLNNLFSVWGSHATLRT